MPIERFIWTIHAEERLDERHLTRGEVEQAVRDGHSLRQLNYGDADWRIHAVRSDGYTYAITYDNPAYGDSAVARIVTAWPLRTARKP
jgi:hypothetical protein